tara:strand:- start:646 stop:1659 length:1014 start_codon:yes stop_codon:yes gene_type:complete
LDFSEIAGRKVLITGGLGFIGSNLAIRCVELGGHVTIITRSLTKKENLGSVLNRVTIHELNLSTADNAREGLQSLLVGQDYIFHMAAQTSHVDSMLSPTADLAANCGVTLELLESCRQLCPDASIVMPGTVTQLGRATNLPVSEDHSDWPLTLYDAHKLTCEKYLYVYYMNYGLKTTMLRLANVFGERQRVNNPKRGILNYMLWRAINGKDLTVYEPGNFIRDYSYVQNCVDALILAGISSKTNGKAYIFGSGIGLEFQEMVNEVVETVHSLTGIKSDIVRVPFPVDEKKMDVGDFVANNSKLCDDTGWYPSIGFVDGLSNTINYYIEGLGEALDEQ